MVKSGWSVSIPITLAVLLLLCQCGNGTGDDGGIIDKGSGNKRNQPFTVKIPTLTTPAASTSVNVVSLNNSNKNSTITSATATITTTTAAPIPVTTSSVLTSARQHISSNIAATEITVKATSKATTVTSSDSSKSNSLTTVVSESKLSSQSNGSSRPFELRGTQLKNDNETVTKALQSTQQPTPPSSSSTITSTESPTNPTTIFPPTSSSAFTASTSIHHSNDFATSIKSQQQQHLQQRSKLWAPHSNVADFLKGMDDDGSTTNSSESHYSKSGSSSHKSNTNLPSEKVGQQTRSIRSIRLIANNNSSTSTSTSGTVNNNNIPAKNFISSSYRHHHNRQESQQARGENDAVTFRYDDNVEKGSIVDGDDHDGDDDDNENNVAVFHVNNKFPVISSIRHYRSRKSFSRTRKSTNPNGVGTTDVYMNRDGSASQHHHDDRDGSGRATTDGVPRNKFNYDSATIAKNQQSRYLSGGGSSSKRHPGKTSQGFGNRLSYSMEALENGGNNENNKKLSDADDNNENAEDSMELDPVGNNNMYEMPQGDAPHPHTEKEKEGGEAVGSRYYFGQVATRKMHEHAGNDDEGIFRAGSAATSSGGSSSAVGVSSQRGGTEHYGKIIDKPMLLRGEGHIIAATKEGQKNSYSSSDDNTPAAVYENSYFIPKDVSSSLASTETTGGGGRGEGVQAGSGMKRRPSQLLSATTTKNGKDEQPPKHLSSAEEKNFTILHRINKTFLSRSSKSRQQKQQHLDGTGSEGNEKHASTSILNADLLVNKASDLNHWQTISPEGRSRGGGSGSNILTESEMGWEKGISADGHDSKGASRRPASGTSSDSSKGINNYFSQSFSSRKSTTRDGSEETPINTSNSQWNGESAHRETNGNMVRDKWKGTLNDSDYAISESGKTHSLQEALPPLSSSNEKTPGVSPTKKQQRNRNGQSKQERRKQRQQSKSSRRPASAIADVPNDPRYENGSGPLSESNNFHASQGNLDFFLM